MAAKHWLAMTTACVLVSYIGNASAGIVGDIQACYNCTHNFGSIGVVDGPTFLIENTSGSTFTNGVFFADIGGGTADQFSFGTIAPGNSTIVEPGVSIDGRSHTGFFRFFGVVRDTSDEGPDLGTTQFRLTGLVDGISVDSGIFTPDATAGPSPDGTTAIINFLGGGSPETDLACSNCFGPKVIATFSTGTSPVGVPEPAPMTLLCVMVVGIYVARRISPA
jgi:hypothetical protein